MSKRDKFLLPFLDSLIFRALTVIFVFGFSHVGTGQCQDLGDAIHPVSVIFLPFTTVIGTVALLFLSKFVVVSHLFKAGVPNVHGSLFLGQVLVYCFGKVPVTRKNRVSAPPFGLRY